MDLQENRFKLQAPGLIIVLYAFFLSTNTVMLHINIFIFLTRSVSMGQFTSG